MKPAMGEEVKPELKVIGDRLRWIVATTGLTDAAFVAALEMDSVTEKTWSKYCLGKRKLPVEVAGRLYLDYGASMEWIYLDIAGPNTDDFKAKLAKAKREALTLPAKPARAMPARRQAAAQRQR